MKTFIIVGIFIFLFFASVNNAQTEKSVIYNLTTALSDSLWSTYTLKVVLIVCSALITLLALTNKTWNDDKNIRI